MSDTSDQPAKTLFLAPRYWPLWLGFGLLRVICLLPLAAQLVLGRGLGRLTGSMAGSRRKIVLRNLAVCFPEWSDDKRNEVCRQHFENLGMSLFETATAWWREDALFENNVTFKGTAAITEALAAGHRLILVTGHFTTLEISGRFLRQIVPEFDAIYRPQRNPLLDERIRRGRLRSARALIQKADIRQMLKSLRKGVSVWYAPDQSYRRKYAELIDFFGTPAMTNTATGRLAALSGALVIPFYCYRDGRRAHYIAEFGSPLKLDDDDQIAMTREFVASLENAIARAPSQYFWIHRRFKGRPDNLPDVYADEFEPRS